MNEKYSGGSRHQPPPISCIVNKPQRSRSVCNELEREPKLQPVRVLERQSSLKTEIAVKSNIDKRSKVGELIEQFDKSKSTDNVHRSTKNLQLLPHYTPALTTANNSKIVFEFFSRTG